MRSFVGYTHRRFKLFRLSNQVGFGDQQLSSMSLTERSPCLCPIHTRKPAIKLQPWMLECWQREQQRRPYTKLTVHGKSFRQKLNHAPTIEDLRVVIEFLTLRAKGLVTFELCYVKLPPCLAEELAISLRGLQSVVLVSVDLPVEVLQTLAQAADEFQIRNLKISGNSLTDQHIRHLYDFLLSNETLQSLDLGYCDLDPRRFSLIADGVVKSKALHTINMSKIVPTTLKSKLSTEKIASVVAILIHQRPLVEVHFKLCELTCHDMAPLAEYLSDGGSTTLKYLDLAGNQIGPHGCRLLFKAIAKGKTLTGLDLANNRLASGGVDIGHLLPSTRLTYLDIANNQISEEGTELILKTLSKPYPIRILNMAGNGCNEAAAIVLRRKLAAKVLVSTNIDICVAYNSDTDKYEVQPTTNDQTQVNNRYFRVAPSKSKFSQD